jgi:hypothetical protein
VTIVLCTTLTHVLEWAGKMRLDREAHIATQSIYYPGFTVAGFAEVVAIVAAAALLSVSSQSGRALWLNATAAGALVALHVTYWVMTHPVNKFWLKDQKLGGLGKTFFAVGSPSASWQAITDPDRLWRQSRDRWELSHAIRAAFAGITFVSLLISITLRP